MPKIVTDITQLRRVCNVARMDECERLDIFGQLEQTLKESNRPGLGLSAIQIGIPIFACIIRVPAHNEGPNGEEHRQATHINMLNPKILEYRDPVISRQEGCLSLPGVFVDTVRYREIVAEWLDYDEKVLRKAVLWGLEAICFEHECDHCLGVLMIDKKVPEPAKPKEIGRNDPCHCGSGKKYKKCCLEKDEAAARNVKEMRGG